MGVFDPDKKLEPWEKWFLVTFLLCLVLLIVVGVLTFYA